MLLRPDNRWLAVLFIVCLNASQYSARIAWELCSDSQSYQIGQLSNQKVCQVN